MEKDDHVSIDFGSGIVRHEGNTYHFPALPVEVLSILEDGGLIPHVRKELGKGVDVGEQDPTTTHASLTDSCWGASLRLGDWNA